MKKLSNTEAELKKSVACQKKSHTCEKGEAHFRIYF